MKHLMRAALAALALLVVAPAFADGLGDAGPDVAAPPVRAQPNTQLQAPQGRTGIIALGDGAVTLNVPTGYRFYSPEEAYAYLQRASASTPSGSVLGLVARAQDNIRDPGTWATVISYDAIGYVQPQTASGLTDANFEADVRSARQTQNRAFEGFITPPAFDANAPTLVWAERAAPPASQAKDLRYEQKVLGREGVAALTSIGSADQMPEIEAAAADLRGMLSFTEGHRFADFQPASDRVSTYSVPGLVTGVPTPAAPQAVTSSTEGSSQTAFGGLSGYFPWIALGVIVLAIAGFMMTRRRNRDDEA
jgi:uncharacterized membrane-anchored protein